MLADLIAGPDGQVDEAALFVCLLGVMTFGTWLVMNGLAVYAVVSHKEIFSVTDFATANAVILGAGGTTAGIIEAFIGTRNRMTQAPPPLVLPVVPVIVTPP